jgi:arsenite/tail-anchored protein-transporting ATPase
LRCGPIAAHTTSVVETIEQRQGPDALAAAGHGLIMVMGKGGVGKTTVAAPSSCSTPHPPAIPRC